MDKKIKNEDEIMKTLHLEKSYNEAGKNLLTSFENYFIVESSEGNIINFLYKQQYKRFKNSFKFL